MRANPAFVFDVSVLLKHLPDVMLQDIEGSPILAIKDVKHAAAAREASSKADAYANLTLSPFVFAAPHGNFHPRCDA